MPGPRRSSTAGRKIVRKDPLPKGRACLACKERKVKCNGQWPCSACVRHAKYEGRAFNSSCCEFRPVPSQRTSSSQSDERVPTLRSSSSSRSPPDSRPATPHDLSPVLATFPDVPVAFDNTHFHDVLATNAARLAVGAVPMAPALHYDSRTNPFAAPFQPVPMPSHAEMPFEMGYATCRPVAPVTMHYATNFAIPEMRKQQSEPVYVLDAEAVSEQLSQFEQYDSVAPASSAENHVAPAGLTPFLETFAGGPSGNGVPFWAM